MSGKRDRNRGKTEDVNGTSQYGGPSEDVQGYAKVRQGQIDWVPAFEKTTEFRTWLFIFRTGAGTYLSKKVYPDAEERKFAWLNALLKAATLGKNMELVRYLDLCDRNGTKCESLLKKLEQKYQPAIEREEQKATESLLMYLRGNKTLTDAVKELNERVLECRKLGYDPDEKTLIKKYETLLTQQERPLYRLYSETYAEGGTDFETTVRVLEKLGRDQEPDKTREHGSGPVFAGHANARQNKQKKHHRHGYAENRNERAEVTNCQRCGSHKCKSMQSGNKEDCNAYDKDCKKCGKKGHFFKMCKTKNAKRNAAAAVTEAKHSSSTEKGCAPF
jgi:hypothetical protein